MIIPPLMHVEQIDGTEADRALVVWGHKMGPCHRPMGTLRAHGMFAHGRLVALSVTADLVRETCAGFGRDEAIELARLCAERPGLCRPMLRIWREFVFPAFGRPWGVSYQDEAIHSGDTYRFDGWVRLSTGLRSGTDRRSGRRGRTKTVWGWHEDEKVRQAVRHVGREALTA
jgi:hypothetical protein